MPFTTGESINLIPEENYRWAHLKKINELYQQGLIDLKEMEKELDIILSTGWVDYFNTVTQNIYDNLIL